MHDTIMPVVSPLAQNDWTAMRAMMRGVQLLDIVRPGWWQEIDTLILDIVHPWRCILGQLYGSYIQGKRALGFYGGPHGYVSGSAYGFAGVPTELWLTVINERRLAIN